MKNPTTVIVERRLVTHLQVSGEVNVNAANELFEKLGLKAEIGITPPRAALKSNASLVVGIHRGANDKLIVANADLKENVKVVFGERIDGRGIQSDEMFLAPIRLGGLRCEMVTRHPSRLEDLAFEYIELRGAHLLEPIFNGTEKLQ